MPKSTPKKTSAPDLSPGAPSLRTSKTWEDYQKSTYAAYLKFASDQLGGTKGEKNAVLVDMLTQWLKTNLEMSEVKAAYAQMMQSAAKGLVPNVKMFVKKKVEKLLKRSKGEDLYDMNVCCMQDFLELDPEANFMADHWDLGERVVTSEGWMRVEEITSILESLFADGAENDEPLDLSQVERPEKRIRPDVVDKLARKVVPPYPKPGVVRYDPRKVTPVKAKPAEALGAPPVSPDAAELVLPIDLDEPSGRPLPRIPSDGKPKTGFQAMLQTFRVLAAKVSGSHANPTEMASLMQMSGYSYPELSAKYARTSFKSHEIYELQKDLFKKIYTAVKNLDDYPDPMVNKKKISQCLDWARDHFKEQKEKAAAVL